MSGIGTSESEGPVWGTWKTLYDLLLQVRTYATCGDAPGALRAAKAIADGAGRDLLAEVVQTARTGTMADAMTDAEIGRALGVTGHAVSQRFPSDGSRRRGRRRRAGG